MITPINDTLYEIICGWWKAYGWPIPQENILSKRRYICFIGEKPMCAGFLYKDESSAFGLMDFIVCNPDSTKEDRAQAIAELVAHIESVAKEIGIKALLTISVTEKLTHKLQDLGYYRTQETHLAHLIKNI